MKIFQKLSSVGIAFILLGGATCINAYDFDPTDGEAAKHDAKVQKLFNVDFNWTYPNSFYGVKFNRKDNKAEAYLIYANYPNGLDPDGLMTPDVLLKNDVAKYLKCESIKVPEGNNDDEHEYDYEVFSDCKVGDKVYHGELFTAGGFYRVAIYDKNISKNDESLINDYNGVFAYSLCAQDCNAQVYSTKLDNSKVSANYIFLPTLNSPISEFSYYANNYYDPKNAQLASYSIFKNSVEPQVLEKGIKSFCGDGVSLQKTDDGYSFSNCVSTQAARNITVKGKVVKKDKLAVCFFHSDGVSPQDVKIFEDEYQYLVDNFDPSQFEDL